MESHEGVIVGIVEFTLDGLFVHIIGNSVVDIQQSYGICADAGSDELHLSSRKYLLHRIRGCPYR